MLRNKIFPQIKKSLKWFLTDESWKVTKKDVLGVSAWTLLVAWLWMDKTLAAAPPCTHISNSPHSSSCAAAPGQPAISGYVWWWHVSRTLQGSSFSYTAAGPGAPIPEHWSAINTAAHASSFAPTGWSVTLYNSWWHLSYTHQWAAAPSQTAISWYTHSSSSSHSSGFTPGVCP